MGDSNSLNIPNMHDQKPLAIPLLLDDGIPTISTHQSQSGGKISIKTNCNKFYSTRNISPASNFGNHKMRDKVLMGRWDDDIPLSFSADWWRSENILLFMFTYDVCRRFLIFWIFDVDMAKFMAFHGKKSNRNQKMIWGRNSSFERLAYWWWLVFIYVCLKKFNFSAINFHFGGESRPPGEAIRRYFDFSWIYSNKCVNKLWICSRRARRRRRPRWLHAIQAAGFTNLKSLQRMSASDVLWPPHIHFICHLTRYITSILCAFIIFERCCRHHRRRRCCCCWCCCGAMARVREDKQSFHMKLLRLHPRQPSSAFISSFSLLLVLLERNMMHYVC